MVRLLEPSAAYAQTAALSAVGGYTITPINLTTGPWQTIFNIMVDVAGGSPPVAGSTFNASVTLTNVAEAGTPWGSSLPVPFLRGASLTSGVVDNVATSSPTGQVSFALNIGVSPPTLNGAAYAAAGSQIDNATVSLVTGNPGDQGNLCINVTADQGTSQGGVGFPSQAVTTGMDCVDALWT